MITDKMVHAAEKLAQDLKYERKRKFKVTVACQPDLTLPDIVGRKLSEGHKSIFYQCTGCPEWHISPRGLPEGVTQKGFIALMRKLQIW